MMLATYRLQLTKDFTLAQAREVVPFLHALGITHLYLSPVLQARQRVPATVRDSRAKSIPVFW